MRSRRTFSSGRQTNTREFWGFSEGGEKVQESLDVTRLKITKQFIFSFKHVNELKAQTLTTH